VELRLRALLPRLDSHIASETVLAETLEAVQNALPYALVTQLQRSLKWRFRTAIAQSQALPTCNAQVHVVDPSTTLLSDHPVGPFKLGSTKTNANLAMAREEQQDLFAVAAASERGEEEDEQDEQDTDWDRDAEEDMPTRKSARCANASGNGAIHIRAGQLATCLRVLLGMPVTRCSRNVFSGEIAELEAVKQWIAENTERKTINAMAELEQLAQLKEKAALATQLKGDRLET